jgi:DMSO/TMAO reductase YedYZ molybdopterin-dependent catalytic subunit
MSETITRRESLRNALLAVGALTAFADQAFPAATGGTDVEFTDIPKTFGQSTPNSTTRLLDIRRIDGPLTPKDQFFAIQHLGRPKVDAATYKLKISGLVKKPVEMPLGELRGMKSVEMIAGYECSGNSGRSIQGLSSNGKWTGVRLSDVLKHVGLDPKAREVVFFGTDKGKQDVVFRGQTFALDQQYGRSITLENAMKPEPMLAWAMNGDPLTLEQGSPLRLVMPGWYGVANVKWLAEIHLQEDRYLGNYQARWYRSLRGVGGGGGDADPDTQWVETEITRLRLKSVIARVRKTDTGHQVLGFALNDGTPLRSVEVKVDEGPWQPATMDPSNSKYSWKLFTHNWKGATPGEHTIVSRVTDMTGAVQPTAEELKTKKTFLEDNSQFPRKLVIG